MHLCPRQRRRRQKGWRRMDHERDFGRQILPGHLHRRSLGDAQPSYACVNEKHGKISPFLWTEMCGVLALAKITELEIIISLYTIIMTSFRFFPCLTLSWLKVSYGLSGGWGEFDPGERSRFYKCCGGINAFKFQRWRALKGQGPVVPGLLTVCFMCLCTAA